MAVLVTAGVPMPLAGVPIPVAVVAGVPIPVVVMAAQTVGVAAAQTVGVAAVPLMAVGVMAVALMAVGVMTVNKTKFAPSEPTITIVASLFSGSGLRLERLWRKTPTIPRATINKIPAPGPNVLMVAMTL
jgi:hypothetical protein